MSAFPARLHRVLTALLEQGDSNWMHGHTAELSFTILRIIATSNLAQKTPVRD